MQHISVYMTNHQGALSLCFAVDRALCGLKLYAVSIRTVHDPHA